MKYSQKERYKQNASSMNSFLRYLVDTVDVWPEGAKAAVYFRERSGAKMRYFDFRYTHPESLSYAWNVITKEEWQNEVRITGKGTQGIKQTQSIEGS